MKKIEPANDRERELLAQGYALGFGDACAIFDAIVEAEQVLYGGEAEKPKELVQ